MVSIVMIFLSNDNSLICVVVGTVLRNIKYLK